MTPEQALKIAASQWKEIPTAEQIIAALRAAGFSIINSFPSDYEPVEAVTGSIASRIASRMAELGKNPSSLALEAGLGRSSVRDIIVGKVASPRVDTLEKLTGPLQCDLRWLTGQ